MRLILTASMLAVSLSPVSLHSQPKCVSGNCNNGYGTLVFPSGGKYIGDFENGKMQGKGIYYFSDGNKYIGHWQDQYREGEGRMVFFNGDEYLGQFHLNKFSGQGTMTYAVGNRYDGNWEDNKPHGQGVMTYNDGSRYEGQWEYGKRNGMGLMVYPSGKQNRGQWVDDQYVEDWNRLAIIGDTSNLRNCNQQFCANGQGKYAYKDGSRYMGDFNNGMPEGNGVVYYKSGDRYEGGWKQSAPHGQGIMYYTDGQVLGAVWDFGKPVRKLFNDVAPPPAPVILVDKSPEVKIWAVVVGAARYSHMPVLRYTDDDAYQLYAFLKSPEGGALPDNQLKVLIDEDATRNNILNTMRSVFQRADENDVVVFYFSGHGLPGAFLPIDFDGINNRLTHEEIKELFKSSRAKHKLVIADACHSGTLLAAKTPIESSLKKYYKAFEESHGGTALLMSSKGEEFSLEDGGLRAGIFSHFLVRGLKGDADANSDDLVNITELFNYVNKQVRIYTANAQSPTLSGDYDANMPVAVIR